MLVKYEDISAGVAQSIDARYFHAIIFPTEQCSFRCSYCYEDFAKGKMSKATRDSLIRFFERRLVDVNNLEISWFGGEPLLAHDVILDIHDQLQERTHVSKISGNITTNGFHLSMEIVRSLLSREVRAFQVSVDGSRRYHDKTRKGKGGFDTFERIWSNLLGMKAIDDKFLMILRIHFSPQNIEGVEELLSHVENEFGDDDRFKIYLKGINHLGGENDEKFDVYSWSDQKIVKERLHSRISEKRMIYSKGTDSYICYASRFNSLAFRSDGAIAKCTVALSDDRNMLGKLLEDGSVSINNDKLKFWTRGLLSGSATEMACPKHT